MLAHRHLRIRSGNCDSKLFQQLKIKTGSVYDDLASKYGRSPVVVGLQVSSTSSIRQFMRRIFFDLVKPGGIAIVSTPYHGYWKNLALALSGHGTGISRRYGSEGISSSGRIARCARS
jgi:hypothetical protein